MKETNQPPCELPSPVTVLGWVGKRAFDVLLVVLLAAILGEVYLRSHRGRPHEYAPDPELGARFRPNQETYRGRINADGHRGSETDWDRSMVVALGDSQAFGSGVPDDAVWTTRLGQLLNDSSTSEPVQVVNSAHPGFGPYQQLVELRRVLARQPRALRAVLVRVSIEDRNFLPPRPETLAAVQAGTEQRQQWRTWTRLAPFVVSRLAQQYPSLVSIVKWSSPSISRPVDASIGESMWTQQGAYWREMIDLASRANIPLVFFVHDPTDLPSNGVLQERLIEAGSGYPRVTVLRLDSAAWGLHPGTTAQLWEQYHGRYTLQHDHHGNELHHTRVAEELSRHLKQQLSRQFADRGAIHHP